MENSNGAKMDLRETVIFIGGYDAIIELESVLVEGEFQSLHVCIINDRGIISENWLHLKEIHCYLPEESFLFFSVQ